jgi:hypothetical protein
MRCDGLTDLQIKDCSISESRRWRLENTTETYNYAVSSRRAALESSRLIHPDATLKLLNCCASEMTHDLASTIDDGLAEGLSCGQRAAWILQSPATARWLDNAQSSMLVINGGEDSHEHNSAVSFSTSMLVRALDAAEDIIVSYCIGFATNDETPLYMGC